MLRPPAGAEPAASVDLDAADHDPLRQMLVLATSPRTGSNLLSTTLAATGVAGVPAEYLLSSQSYQGWRRRWNLPQATLRGNVGMAKRRLLGEADWWVCSRFRPSSRRKLVERCIQHRTTVNGVFALKVHARDFREWTNDHGLDLAEWNVPVRWVHLRREDRLAQAVSFVIAEQTDQWTSLRSTNSTPEYDPARIAVIIQRIDEWEQFWLHWFTEHLIRPLELTYEQLTADFEASVTAVLGLLGVEAPVPAPPIERQASEVNRVWIERFIVDQPDLARAARIRA